MSDKDFTPTEPILVDTPNVDEGKAQATVNQSDSPGLQSLRAGDFVPQVSAPNTPPSASSSAPQPGPAAHTGMTVDERAYQQYQALAQVVLDSADIASQSAQAAASASSQMNKATSEFRALTEVGHKKALILLGATGGLMLICLIFFLVMGVRMNSRINQLDAMVLAVGKRAVELSASLESLSSVQQSMENLAGKQNELKRAQAEFQSRIENSLKQSESIAQKVPQETAKQVAASSGTMLKQVQDINQRLSSQTSAVQKLGSEINALKTATANVDTLKRDVEALITLQRERYLETVQKTNQSQQRERAVQYPRRDGKPLEATPRQQ